MTSNIAIEAQAIITPIEATADGKPQRPKLDITAYNGGLVSVAGYRHPIAIDLDGLGGLDKSHPVYRNHDEARIVGHGTTTRDGNTLIVAGKLSANNAHSQEVVDLAAEGFPWQASVGVKPSKIEEIKAGATALVNGQSVTGPAFIARKGKLYEVSVVSVGADDTTSTRISAKKDIEGMDTVDSVIEAANKEIDNLVSYERIVQAAIDRGMSEDLATKLVDAAQAEKVDVRDFELKVLRASRATPINAQRHSNSLASNEVIEAAVARSIGDTDAESQYTPEVLEASEKQFKHGLSLIQLMQMACKRNGHGEVSHRDIRALLKGAFAPIQASGISTIDISGVLSNLANKMIKSGFESVEDSWRMVSAIRPVNDFKMHTSYSLTGDFVYKEVPPTGELTHATLGEEKYENQAKTFGRMFALTRTDFVNDDLGSFNRVRTLLGRGAALAFNKIFWTEFLKALATFYTVPRANRITASPLSALSVDGLTKAFEMFGDLTDPAGTPLGLSPAMLVVPNALKISGERLTQDPELRITGASAKTVYTTANPHAGKVSLVNSSYLNNANIPGGSAAHWWLMADPMDMALIETVFLYGRQFPTIESADADFDTLGAQLRGYHDFGVAKQEYRSAIYSDGTP